MQVTQIIDVLKITLIKLLLLIIIITVLLISQEPIMDVHGNNNIIALRILLVEYSEVVEVKEDLFQLLTEM